MRMKMLAALAALAVCGRADAASLFPFQPYKVIPVASGASSVAVGDVNGDGLPDLVATTWSSQLLVLLQKADGSLAAPVTIGTIHDGALAIADLNADGVGDIVLAGDNGVTVVPGNRSASFVPKPTVAWPDGTLRKGARSLAFVDVDSDGHLDVVASSYSSDSPTSPGIFAFYGNGAAGFSKAAVLQTPGYVFNGGKLTFGDLNGDGHLDLLVRDAGQGYVLMHTGTTGYVAPQILPGYTNTTYAALPTGDFDGDRRTDFAAVRTSPNAFTYSYLYHWANGALTQYATASNPGFDILTAAAFDADGDGYSDLFGSYRTDAAFFYLHNGAGGFVSAYNVYTLPAPLSPMAYGDINHDGHIDLVMGGYDQGLVALYGRASQKPADAVHGDFNGDGYADLLWRQTQNGSNVLWNAANGARQTAVAALGTDYVVAGTGDFDGDGRADVLWRNRVTGANVIWRSANSTLPRAVGAVGLAWNVAGVGDFDGDGRADIFWRNTTSGTNVIWRSGDMSTPLAVASVTDQAWQVAGIGDFDGDGASDVFWRNRNTGTNAIWRSANAQTTMSTGAAADLSWQVVGVGDLDGDGRSDVVWRHAKTGADVLWKWGDYARSQALTQVTNLAWRIVTVGDFDHDGRSDLVWRNNQSGTNVIWRGGDSSQTQSVSGVSNLDWVVAY